MVPWQNNSALCLNLGFDVVTRLLVSFDLNLILNLHKVMSNMWWRNIEIGLPSMLIRLHHNYTYMLLLWHQ